MSWLFGILRKKGTGFPSFELNEEFQKVETPTLFLTISNNNHSSFLRQSSNFLQAIVGIPIIEKNGCKKLLIDELNHNPKSVIPENLFGHYVLLSYNKNKLEIKNDVLGLRELYYFENNEHFFFSTRIDLLRLYNNELSIDTIHFSSLWLSNFQISNNSIISNIEKLGPGGKIHFDEETVKVIHSQYSIETNIKDRNNFSKIVSPYCKIKSDSNETISLALSGGIDSRFIVSILTKIEQDFICHTFLNEENNDIEIAEKICKSLNVKHELIPRLHNNLGINEQKILDYYKSIPPVIPITQLMDFGFYGLKYLKSKLILDGGFGGFYRRQYLNKIYISGFKNFDLNNLSSIKNALYAPKPIIFNSVFNDKLVNNYALEIKNLISKYNSPANKSELVRVLDLISVRCMLANIYSAGQTILDQEILSIMPLAQKDVIDYGINMSLEEKLNNKSIKSNISNNNPLLTKINLVNNNTQLSYSTNYKLFMVKLLIKRKLYRSRNYDRYKILFASKEYVIDTLNSNYIEQNPYLDHKNNLKIAHKFYEGDTSLSSYLDWLLTFILWSKANNIN
jgi:hypothetical protein